MADYVNPYRTVLAPYFPNITGQEYKQDPSKVTHYLIYLNQKAPLNQWLHPNPSKVQTKVSQRINALVTDKKLHPLHLCAMLNQEKMAEMLLETKVCQIDSQDYLGFTPLHHAAVNNFKNMIALFIKYGANQTLTNSRQGTYLEVLNLVHPSIDPLKQTFYYKDTQTGDIVQGNGIDFQQYTGAETFLDKEPVISVNEAVNEWATNPAPDAEANVALVPVLQKAYQQFLKHPPSIYLEKHPVVGVDVCVQEEIQAGTVVAEYLGEIKPGMSLSLVDNSYLFDPFDAEHKRGIGALINDGFPNSMTFQIPNTEGVLNRIVICATSKIPKGGSVVYNYGVGPTIKFERHHELYDKEMTTFFKKYTNQNSNSIIRDYESSIHKIHSMNEGNASLRTCDLFNKLLYLAVTPHAILKLVCEEIITIEAVQPLFDSLNKYYADYPTQRQAMSKFISDVQQFSDAIKGMDSQQAKKCRKIVLEKLPQMNVEELSGLLKKPNALVSMEN